MYDVVVKKVHVCYLISWRVLVLIDGQLSGQVFSHFGELWLAGVTMVAAAAALLPG